MCLFSRILNVSRDNATCLKRIKLGLLVTAHCRPPENIPSPVIYLSNIFILSRTTPPPPKTA